MSYDAMTWATAQKLPCTQKMVLVMLADRVNKDTGKCIPSIKRLAEDCGLSESCVQKNLKKLAEMGLIKVHSRFNDGVQLPNQYEMITGPISTPGVSDTPPRCTSSTPRVYQVRTEPGSLTSNITNIPPNPQKGETKKADKNKKTKTDSITLKEYLQKCKDEGVDAIPKEDSVFRHAQDSGLPIEFVALAWAWLKDKYLDSKKRYKDWRQVFRNAVNGTWGRLWWFDPASNEYRLTTVGIQFKNRINAQEAIGC